MSGVLALNKTLKIPLARSLKYVKCNWKRRNALPCAEEIHAKLLKKLGAEGQYKILFVACAFFPISGKPNEF